MAKRPKTLVQVLASPIVKAVESVANDVFKCTGRYYACDAIENMVDVFLNGRIAGANIVMYDRTPMVRVILRYRGKAYRLDKTHPLEGLLSTIRTTQSTNRLPVPPNGYAVAYTSQWTEFADKLLPLLPQDLVAMKLADIENAAAAALQDPKKTGPIHGRLAAKRAADKEKLLARIREVFKGHDDLVSKEEILQMWDETFVAEVMDS